MSIPYILFRKEQPRPAEPTPYQTYFDFVKVLAGILKGRPHPHFGLQAAPAQKGFKKPRVNPQQYTSPWVFLKQEEL